MTFLVAQMGARMHYAIPIMLHRRGMLDLLYTDFCLKDPAYRVLSRLETAISSPMIRRALRRRIPEVPDRQVRTFPALGMEYAMRLRRASTSRKHDETFLWAGKALAASVLSHGFGAARSLYVFNTAGLELARVARESGVRIILEQTIAPRSVERELMLAERALHPGWETAQEDYPAVREIIEREEEEWSLADVVLCASPFVREAVVAKGGDPNRCAIVPYGFDIKHGAIASSVDLTERQGPLRVLTVGGIGLRKGTPDLLRAAAILGGAATFRLVGPIVAPRDALANLPGNVEILGPKPFDEVVEEYRNADVFLLPSICEGSATSIYEAMSFGLPIICTPNCGSVVRDGVEGYIVPIRDPEALADRLTRLHEDIDGRSAMAHRAAARSREFDLNAYGRRLMDVIAPADGGGYC